MKLSSYPPPSLFDKYGEYSFAWNITTDIFSIVRINKNKDIIVNWSNGTTMCYEYNYFMECLEAGKFVKL